MIRLLTLGLCAVSVSAAWAGIAGQLKSSTDYYLEEQPTETPPLGKRANPHQLVPYVYAELSAKQKFTRNFRFQMRAYGIANTDSKRAPEKLFGDVPEGFLEYKLSDFKVRAGMNTANWGVVDISSPSDTVNTAVLFHPLRTYKRGAPMLEMAMDKGVFGFHAIYIPRQAPPVLPSTDSRWLPRRFLVNIVQYDTRLELPDPMEYEYLPSETLDHALDHNAGLKLFSHLGSWDFQLTHFEGAAPSPKVRPSLTIDATGTVAKAVSPVGLAPVYYRVRTTGFGMSWAGEKLIFRAESAYQHTISKDPLLQPWMWSNVAALETNMEVGSSTITWLTQYYHTVNPQKADNLISSSYRMFDETAVLGARWAVNDRTTVTASALYEIQEMGWFFMAGFDHKITDALKWGLGWRDFSASHDGLIKTYERNDHASMDLTYYF